jgi:hypothetical protein
VRKEIGPYGYNGHEGGAGFQSMRQLAFARDITRN